MTCAECFARLLCARTACCPLCRLPLLERARVAPGAPGRPAARAAWLQRVILHYVHARAAPLLERRSSAVHSLCRGSRTLWLATAYQHAGHSACHLPGLERDPGLSARAHAGAVPGARSPPGLAEARAGAAAAAGAADAAHGPPGATAVPVASAGPGAAAPGGPAARAARAGAGPSGGAGTAWERAGDGTLSAGAAWVEMQAAWRARRAARL